MTVTDAIEIVGVVLLIAGIAVFSWPVALIVAGLLLIAASFLLAKQGRDRPLLERVGADE